MHQITLIRFILSNISADTGVPRKPSLDVPQSPSHGVPQSPSHRVTSGGGLERVGKCEGVPPCFVHHRSSGSSSSEESGDEEDESGDEEDESGEEEDIERTPEQILEAAGVDMASLEGLSCDERHRTPLELLTEVTHPSFPPSFLPSFLPPSFPPSSLPPSFLPYKVILVIYLQFLSCVMREKYEAARLLCEKGESCASGDEMQ